MHVCACIWNFVWFVHAEYIIIIVNHTLPGEEISFLKELLRRGNWGHSYVVRGRQIQLPHHQECHQWREIATVWEMDTPLHIFDAENYAPSLFTPFLPPSLPLPSSLPLSLPPPPPSRFTLVASVSCKAVLSQLAFGRREPEPVQSEPCPWWPSSSLPPPKVEGDRHDDSRDPTLEQSATPIYGNNCTLVMHIPNSITNFLYLTVCRSLPCIETLKGAEHESCWWRTEEGKNRQILKNLKHNIQCICTYVYARNFSVGSSSTKPKG
jgi:hypothetical protein